MVSKKGLHHVSIRNKGGVAVVQILCRFECGGFCLGTSLGKDSFSSCMHSPFYFRVVADILTGHGILIMDVPVATWAC